VGASAQRELQPRGQSPSPKPSPEGRGLYRQLTPRACAARRQDAAVEEIFELVDGIDPAARFERELGRSVGAGDVDGDHLARAQAGDILDRDRLVPVEAERLRSVPSANCSGSTPMPTRFERWMRSKLSVITARTPSNVVPFAAQSRDEPVPYSLPAMTTSGVPSAFLILPSPRRRSPASRRSARYTCVMPPSTPGTISLRMRMLAKVPRIMTSWLPRRAPYELKSPRLT
jgi:hypothetical protein